LPPFVAAPSEWRGEPVADIFASDISEHASIPKVCMIARVEWHDLSACFFRPPLTPLIVFDLESLPFAL
jgi:hypothetical protein